MRRIKLTQGKFAIVDEMLLNCFSKYSWYAASSGNNFIYAASAKRIRKTKITMKIFMHHCVIGMPLNRKMQIDHINGNTLDNRRENLRIVTVRQNAQNRKYHRDGTKTSEFLGVCFHKKSKRWRATLTLNKKSKYIGSFENEIEAKKAYDNYCKGRII